MDTPIALIIFNRPHYTKSVFKEIRKIKPSKLFVIADGPRPDHPEDIEKCSEAREIVDHIDWECEVFKDYSERNLGCGLRPATGISWVFEHVEEAIILEDDCLPNQSFFRFCDELLERYSDDERIMHIAGNNFQFGRQRGFHSYFFSFHNISWGWATWRRAWKHHDMGLSLWPELKESQLLLDIIDNPIAVEYWKDKFEKAYKCEGEIDYWDYQWTFACWSQSGLSILPNETLVSNIGCGRYATHTKNSNSKIANLPKKEIRFPLIHPQYVIRNFEADKYLIESLVVPQHKNKLQIGLAAKLRRKIFLRLSSLVNAIMRKH